MGTRWGKQLLSNTSYRVGNTIHVDCHIDRMICNNTTKELVLSLYEYHGSGLLMAKVISSTKGDAAGTEYTLYAYSGYSQDSVVDIFSALDKGVGNTVGTSTYGDIWVHGYIFVTDLKNMVYPS